MNTNTPDSVDKLIEKIEKLPGGWPMYKCGRRGYLSCGFITDDLKSLVSDRQRLLNENADYKKWMEFYGIEVVSDEEGVHTKFQPSTMDKWRKIQAEKEGATGDKGGDVQ